MRVLSRLLLKPSGHSPLDFSLRNQFAFAQGVQPLLDLLANVDVVLDIFQGCIFGQVVEELANLFFGRFHPRKPPSDHILPRGVGSWDTFERSLSVVRITAGAHARRRSRQLWVTRALTRRRRVQRLLDRRCAGNQVPRVLAQWKLHHLAPRHVSHCRRGLRSLDELEELRVGKDPHARNRAQIFELAIVCQEYREMIGPTCRGGRCPRANRPFLPLPLRRR